MKKMASHLSNPIKPKIGEYYSLDNFGLDFWLFLQETMNLDEITKELISIYDISSDHLW